MEFSEEWKSFFPIGSVYRAPLLLSSSSSKPILGPLCFNPKPQTLTHLFNSPSLSPPLLNPPPQLTLSRFLSVSTTPESPIPLSCASSIASFFGPQPHQSNADCSSLSYNRLQFLRYPHLDTVVVFFSTGCNHDQVGFLILSVEGTSMEAVGDRNGGVFVASRHLNQKIVRILVNPVADSGCFEGKFSSVSLGYLLVHGMYAVHWFRVSVSEGSERPAVGYVGCKIFKSSLIVGACWSPHLHDESVVLLDNGALFLFDLGSKSSNGYFSGTRLKVSWHDSPNSRSCKWLGCEFSWHPRILIVARSDAVFLVDWRYSVCNVTCLVKIDVFRVYAPVEKECFIAFSKAISDHFHFVLASDSMLFLCNVRKPFMPMLQWAHGLDKPCYIDVFSLSDLRSNSKDKTHEWANVSGFGIVLGSFWNCEFSLFCYGPPLPARGSIASEVSRISKSIYAWELPSALFLSGHECRCGSCVVREEFLKDTLPEWVDWQQKKDIVLGFGILSNDLSSMLFDLDEFGGFTLIRLMSSGKLELQRYSASWDLVRQFDATHGEPLLCSENNLFHSFVEEDYKFPKRYKYMKFDYLAAFLDGNLSRFLDSNLTKPSDGPREEETFSLDFHEILCEKLKICRFSQLRTSPAISVVLNDINLPTSIHEVALRRMWAGLPIELLQLAFSSYCEFLDVLLDQKKVALEFLLVPNLPQLPPFFLRKPSNRSSRWSHKVPRSDALVGPVLPLPILITLHEFRNGCLNSEEEIGGFSSEVELSVRCNEVMQVAREMAVPDSSIKLHDDDGVSLADDRVDIWADSRKPKSFCLYHPVAVRCSTKSHGERNSEYEDDRFAFLISKVHNKYPTHNEQVETVREELFDDLCPIGLKFDTTVMNFGSKELKAYNLLKRHFSKWQEGFDPYKRFCTQFVCQK